MFKIVLPIIVFFVVGVSSNPSCPKLKEGMTNVHLVCHTHDDVGWLKTVDQYYYGSRKHITWVGVQYILDSVVDSLQKDPSRKFIYVESAFFFRWWNEQNEEKKKIVKKLVKDGQLEFINGGWCMNDEAGAHYNAIIDQMTLGLVKLNNTFGEDAAPRIGWQIDPFGHSREQASLFAQMGFDGLFFGRLDYDDKTNRWNNKQMEMIWKGSESLSGDSAWLFTGVLPRAYSPPQGFCFDLLCADDPIMDDPALEDYNKDKLVKKFLNAVADQQKGYATSNIVMTMGEDFDYVNAESWYKNLDKLMKYVNELQTNGSKVNVMYSTPSCYLDALHASNITWPTKSDDFFPYASDPHAFWTGYFTSRPTLKWFIRHSNNILQASKQLLSLAGLHTDYILEKLSKAMAVAQHHDAVTGTAKQHVTNDYSKRLFDGITNSSAVYEEALLKVVLESANHVPTYDRSFNFCFQLNISSCSYTENHSQFVVGIYNPIGRFRNYYVRIPVAKDIVYVITDKKGNKMEYQVVPLPDAVLNIPGRESIAKFELVFQATDIPPLGMKQYYVEGKDSLFQKLIPSHRTQKESFGDASITKGNISIVLNEKTKKVEYIIAKTDLGLKKISISQDWFWYAGMSGNNSHFNLRASGAYIFRPNGTGQSFTDKIKNTIHDGPLVSELHQEWAPWVTQILRLYKNENFVEMEWLVGPIPIDDNIGKEIINRISLHQMKTNNTFYTDANGREMIKRIKNHRGTWNLTESEPISQNYYPVTSRMMISSVNGQGDAALLNDRSQGGTSMRDGELELMVHRRLLDDDAFGVGEALNETAFGKGLVARGRHYLIHSAFNSPDCDFSCQHRSLGEKILLQPILTFSNSPQSLQSWIQEGSSSKLLGLTKPLPSNIHLLTLEPRGQDGKLLLRLENFYEKKENHINATVSIELKNLLSAWSITSAEELTLGANKLKKDVDRLKWKPEQEPDSDHNQTKSKDNLSEMSYEFAPMQIRTFLITVEKKKFL